MGGKWELEEANDDVNKQDNDMIIEGIRFRELTQNESDDIDGIGFQKKKISNSNRLATFLLIL